MFGIQFVTVMIRGTLPWWWIVDDVIDDRDRFDWLTIYDWRSINHDRDRQTLMIDTTSWFTIDERCVEKPTNHFLQHFFKNKKLLKHFFGWLPSKIMFCTQSLVFDSFSSPIVLEKFNQNQTFSNIFHFHQIALLDFFFSCWQSLNHRKRRKNTNKSFSQSQ